MEVNNYLDVIKDVNFRIYEENEDQKVIYKGI